MDTKQLYQQYIVGNYKRADVCFVSGQGSLLLDESGKEYIDLGSGIAVNTLGIADEGWADAVAAQLRQLAHCSNLYYSRPQAQLAEVLCRRTGLQKVFFSNSGAEANETMIKAARKYAADLHGDGVRPVIISLQNSFHGRTLAALAATGQPAYHRDFSPFPGGFCYAEPNNMESLRQRLEENKGRCCAILLELVQGEGGVLAMTAAFVAQAAALAREQGLLLLIDEVQTGNGRTGTLYAFEQYGIQPDILSTAKGLAGGLPLGATLFGEKTAQTLTPGSHGSTFGGNPACAAAALYILGRLDEAFLAQVRQKSERVRTRLAGLPGVVHLDGLGLMLGVKTRRPAAEVQAECLAKGVVVLTAKDKIRLLPALNIPGALLDRGLDVLAETMGRE
ncbi:MAG: aminotransferase class III-fold pyridoxal phosphate-dependent enzyme [Oscillospiraceae bacterium]|jgi:acetylornithine/N-succinyldiaminopimelate aminotransferase|nr:aminotransferase class III-fold pyridoxal phosphate-dependent enzyme [Oscillospiraceae bacterium]